MKKIFVFVYILIFLSVLACNKKIVQLPKIELDSISKIENHSSLWIFFETKGTDTIAILNKNNKILNTNWIFNIDKRLTMGNIIPFLVEMQKDKNKESMHKKEGMRNYFSYANTKDNSISLVIFQPTTFIYSELEFDPSTGNKEDEKIIEVNLQNENLFLNNKKIEKDEAIKKIQQIQFNDSLNHYTMKFKYTQNTIFQNYLSVKLYLLTTGISLDSKEYVYSLK